MNFFKKRKKYNFFLAVVLLLIFLNIIGFSSFGQKILGGAVNSVAVNFRKIFKSSESEQGKSREQLREEIDWLSDQLAGREAELAQYYALAEENEKLRQYLNFLDQNNFDYVLANIVWSENLLNLSNYNQNLVIDKGRADGLSLGLVAVNESGLVIGKIIEVNERNSRLCLISNNFCKLAVSANNSDRSVGVAEGNLGLSIKLNYVSQSESLNLGDMIITSGLEKNIPRGLAVGRINFINKEINDIWQEVNAEALFNLNNLNIVSVIVPK